MSSDNTLDPESDLPTGAFTGDVPPIDDQLGLPLIWPKDAQPALDDGIRWVEQWLNGQGHAYLWTSYIRGRITHSTPVDKTAYEVGFLTRLQQHLRRMPQ
ncbi:LasR-specific antiactivator QslA [Pseudomonas sp. NY15435]|uniref:LasR-specific antiactivator QslA n=1 Tax=Pseudomonas sp. NY15435 TaxID=3400358 RepID=UPI003A8A42C3